MHRKVELFLHVQCATRTAFAVAVSSLLSSFPSFLCQPVLVYSCRYPHCVHANGTTRVDSLLLLSPRPSLRFVFFTRSFFLFCTITESHPRKRARRVWWRIRMVFVTRRVARAPIVRHAVAGHLSHWWGMSDGWKRWFTLHFAGMSLSHVSTFQRRLVFWLLRSLTSSLRCLSL